MDTAKDGTTIYRYTVYDDPKNHRRKLKDLILKKTSDGSGYYLVKEENNVFDAEGKKYVNGGGFINEYPDPTLPPELQRKRTTQETPEENEPFYVQVPEARPPRVTSKLFRRTI